jgi:hypothetical protein
MIRVPPQLRVALLPCLALGFLSLIASEARAECGDYVIVHRAGQAGSANSVQVVSSLQSHVADGSIWRLVTTHSGSNPAKPCYGTSCSNRVPIPFAPTRALVQSSPDWALPVIPLTLASAEPALLDLVPANPVSSHRFAPILRPPRVA